MHLTPFSARGCNIALALAACAILTSCSSTEHPNTGNTSATQPGDTPSFSGPWADMFRDEYSRAPNDEVRGYLSDGIITEAENQAVTEAFRTCMTANGLTFDDFEYDGSYSFGFEKVSGADEANEIATKCEMTTGADQVAFLYHQMKLNPENRELTTDIAACLVRSGVVPSDYNAENYKEHPLLERATTNAAEAKAAEETCKKDLAGAFRD